MLFTLLMNYFDKRNLLPTFNLHTKILSIKLYIASRYACYKLTQRENIYEFFLTANINTQKKKKVEIVLLPKQMNYKKKIKSI
jgi:hypothetical protein